MSAISIFHNRMDNETGGIGIGSIRFAQRQRCANTGIYLYTYIYLFYTYTLYLYLYSLVPLTINYKGTFILIFMFNFIQAITKICP